MYNCFVETVSFVKLIIQLCHESLSSLIIKVFFIPIKRINNGIPYAISGKFSQAIRLIYRYFHPNDFPITSLVRRGYGKWDFNSL